MKIKKFVGIAAATAIAATFTIGAAAEQYNAYIAFQNAAYTFRERFENATYGRDSDYYHNIIVWGGNDPENMPEYEDNFDYDISGFVFSPTITDAVIDGNGTYKVGITDFDFTIDNSVGFRFLYLSTDIPSDAGATISDVKVIIDGEVAATYDARPVDPDLAKSGYYGVMIANEYNDKDWTDDMPEYVEPYPTTSLELEFTVSGLADDEPTTDESTTDEPTTDESTTDEPTTDEPTTDEPTTDEPTTDEPTTDAPTTGDTTKPNTNTGVEGIAVVAGVAVLATGAVIISKKRK